MFGITQGRQSPSLAARKVMKVLHAPPDIGARRWYLKFQYSSTCTDTTVLEFQVPEASAREQTADLQCISCICILRPSKYPRYGSYLRLVRRHLHRISWILVLALATYGDI